MVPRRNAIPESRSASPRNSTPWVNGCGLPEALGAGGLSAQTQELTRPALGPWHPWPAWGAT